MTIKVLFCLIIKIFCSIKKREINEINEKGSKVSLLHDTDVLYDQFLKNFKNIKTNIDGLLNLIKEFVKSDDYLNYETFKNHFYKELEELEIEITELKQIRKKYLELKTLTSNSKDYSDNTIKSIESYNNLRKKYIRNSEKYFAEYYLILELHSGNFLIPKDSILNIIENISCLIDSYLDQVKKLIQ